jgi:flagellar motor component MotA
MVLLLVGQLLYWGIILAAIIMGGGIGAFIDIPSIILIFGGTFGLMLVSYSPQEIADSVTCTLLDSQDTHKIKQAAFFWFALVRILFGVGAISTIIGWMQMLGSLSDPNAIGPSMAISLLTFLYALLLSFAIPIPAYYICKQRHANAVANPTPREQGGLQ